MSTSNARRAAEIARVQSFVAEALARPPRAVAPMPTDPSAALDLIEKRARANAGTCVEEGCDLVAAVSRDCGDYCATHANVCVCDKPPCAAHPVAPEDGPDTLAAVAIAREMLRERLGALRACASAHHGPEVAQATPDTDLAPASLTDAVRNLAATMRRGWEEAAAWQDRATAAEAEVARLRGAP